MCYIKAHYGCCQQVSPAAALEGSQPHCSCCLVQQQVARLELQLLDRDAARLVDQQLAVLNLQQHLQQQPLTGLKEHEAL